MAAIRRTQLCLMKPDFEEVQATKNSKILFDYVSDRCAVDTSLCDVF